MPERYVLTQAGGDLLLFALQQIAPNCLTLPYDTLLQALRTAKFGRTRPLHRQGFWNVLARVLSPDASGSRAPPAATTACYPTGTPPTRSPSSWRTSARTPPTTASPTATKLCRSDWRRSSRAPAAPSAAQAGCARSTPARCPTEPKARSCDSPTARSCKRASSCSRCPGVPSSCWKRPAACWGTEQAQVRALIDSVEPIPLFKLFPVLRRTVVAERGRSPRAVR